MTDGGEIMRLVERLEKLQGPDRELDLEVARAVCTATIPDRMRHLEWAGDPGTAFKDSAAHDEGFCLSALPRYTASIDAKLPGENIVRAVFLVSLWEAAHSENGINGPFHVGHHASEAVARRIAALKARARARAQAKENT